MPRTCSSIRTAAALLTLVLPLLAPYQAPADTSLHQAHQPASTPAPAHEDPTGTAPTAGAHEGHGPTSARPVNVYSLFMHHAAGVGLILVSLFLLAHRLTEQRFPLLRLAIGATWLSLGIFLFIRSDPEGWPIGPAGLFESFTMPTRSEWIQHKLLSMIPMFMGIYAGRPQSQAPHPLWNYVAAGLALFGALALMVHQHLDHPGMDITNIQHRFFAATALVIAGSLVVDGKRDLTWAIKPYLLPCSLLILGLQLAFYVE